MLFACAWSPTRGSTQGHLMQELRTLPLSLFFLLEESCPQKVPPCDLLSNSQIVLGSPFFHKHRPNSAVLKGQSNIRLQSAISFVLFPNWFIPWMGKRGCYLSGSFKDHNHLKSPLPPPPPLSSWYCVFVVVANCGASSIIIPLWRGEWGQTTYCGASSWIPFFRL